MKYDPLAVALAQVRSYPYSCSANAQRHKILTHTTQAECIWVCLMGNKASKISERQQQDNSSRERISLDRNSDPPIQDSVLLVREDNRYRASSLLTGNDVQNVVWLEDLLALHGSNTMVWDLNLLVQDPLEAATCLEKLGYHRTASEARFQHDSGITERSIGLVKPASTETAVILLPAQDWYYDVQKQGQNPVPPLHSFLDSAMELWLNISSKNYTERLGFALYIAALISDCYALTDEEGGKVKTTEYGERLKVEHRELHYDIVAGKQSFTHTARHRYHAQKYREIKGGFFTPVPHHKDGYRPQLGTLAE